MRNITAVNAFTDPVTTLEDGDPVVELSTDPTSQALTNRTHNLNLRTTAVEAALHTYSAASHRKGVASGILGLGTNGEAIIGPTTVADALTVSCSADFGVGLRSTVSGGTAYAVYGLASNAGGVGVFAQAPNATGVALMVDSTSGKAIDATSAKSSVFRNTSGNGTLNAVTDDSLELTENLLLSGSIPAVSTLMGKRLTPGNLLRAWGNVTAQGSSAPTVNDGYSFTAAANGAATVRITIPTMANDDYAVTFGSDIFSGVAVMPFINAKTTSTFDVKFALVSDGSIVGTDTGIVFHFAVHARS